MLNLASSAGLPAGFPLDAADFANYPGTDRLCTLNVQQNLQCGSSALENPPGDLSKLQIFMVCLGKCCGERFKYVCWILKEMVKVPWGFLSNDGIALISILIVHKFKLKVSVCTTS